MTTLGAWWLRTRLTPAFMQCPTTEGLAAYKKLQTTPDDLDLLATAKNHDVKSSIASHAEADDWVFALIDVQTMSGYWGAGHHRIARMNGGYSSRPCLGLAPADGGLGAHLVHDIRRMIELRDRLSHAYAPHYFDPENGLALLWLEPWDGTNSFRMEHLDPYFIEICRRGAPRMPERPNRWTDRYFQEAADFRCRSKRGCGRSLDTGDRGRQGALPYPQWDFRYDRLQKLILDGKAFRLPPAMEVDTSSDDSWQLVARGIAAGQGKTEGYHERTDIVLGPKMTRSMLSGGEGRDELAELGKAQIEEINEVTRALGLAIAIAASGGKDAASLSKSDRERGYPYLRRLDSVADSHFFSALQERFEVPEEDRPAARRVFARLLIRRASALLREATQTVPYTSIHRFRAQARATSAFWWRLRRPESVFSDQEAIFVTSNPEEEERAS